MTARLTALLQEVHTVLQAQGAAGAALPEMMKLLPGITKKALQNRLSRLIDRHLAEQDKVRGPYYALGMRASDMTQSLRQRCMALVADCPSGVSDAVMAQELGLTRNYVRQALQQDLADGTVWRVRMPAAHGGGMGWALVNKPAAPAVPMPTSAAETDGPAGSSSASGAFDLLDGQRLALAWSDARIVLPADVTRGLFRYLDALGGLHNEQRLCAPGLPASTTGVAP